MIITGTQDYAEYCQRKQLNSSSFEARPPQQFNSEEALPEVNMITEVRLEEETVWKAPTALKSPTSFLQEKT